MKKKNHHLSLQSMQRNLAPLIQDVKNHSIYSEIKTIEHLKIFTQEHVFIVWDFMCLLKELHRQLVSTSAPWFPPKDALSAHLISSILLEEESDLVASGSSYASHFELYIQGMEAIGASTDRIHDCLSALKNGYTLNTALENISLRKGTRNFVLTTFRFFKSTVHELASAFVFGREGITSEMFSSVLNQLEKRINSEEQSQIQLLKYYFKRHIELDSNEHFPKSLRMLSNLIGQDRSKWLEAETAAHLALKARLAFLNDLEASLREITPA